MSSSPPAIHHLGCGTMCPHSRRLINGEGGLLEDGHIVCHCLLVERSDGLVLIDTGLGLEDMRDLRRLGRLAGALLRPQSRQPEAAVEQVRALGFDPRDVRQVLVTHLDLDHAGGLPDFPGAEVHVLGRELDAAMNPTLRERERYVKVHWAHGPRWVRHEPGGEDWLGFESVRVLPGDGDEILLVPLYGHTRGHAGVAVRSGERWLLHCGDAFFNRGEVQTPPVCPPFMRLFQRVNSVDNAARKHNAERLRELAQRAGEHGVELFCAHDPVTLERMRARG